MHSALHHRYGNFAASASQFAGHELSSVPDRR